jgi:hypothetical protein
VVIELWTRHVIIHLDWAQGLGTTHPHLGMSLHLQLQFYSFEKSNHMTKAIWAQKNDRCCIQYGYLIRKLFEIQWSHPTSGYLWFRLPTFWSLGPLRDIKWISGPRWVFNFGNSYPVLKLLEGFSPKFPERIKRDLLLSKLERFHRLNCHHVTRSSGLWNSGKGPL